MPDKQPAAASCKDEALAQSNEIQQRRIKGECTGNKLCYQLTASNNEIILAQLTLLPKSLGWIAHPGKRGEDKTAWEET